MTHLTLHVLRFFLGEKEVYTIALSSEELAKDFVLFDAWGIEYDSYKYEKIGCISDKSYMGCWLTGQHGM